MPRTSLTTLLLLSLFGLSVACTPGQLTTTGDLSDTDTSVDGGETGRTDDSTPTDDEPPVSDEPPTMDEEQQPPAAELVRDECGDGLDNDADGEIDEACVCVADAVQDCYGGAPELAGVGQCLRGTQDCNTADEFGNWDSCLDWVAPEEETCNGVDDDCDGTADEGCSCAIGEPRSCYTGPAGSEGVGVCLSGSQVCQPVEDGSAGWAACVGSVLPGIETCGDGLDNDCDGEVDEGCTCDLGTTTACYARPDGTLGEGSSGVGICRGGAATCAALPGGGSDFGACMGAVFAAPEICDNGLDDDCDGEVDEGCTPPGPVDCTVADVLFLVDVTGSMGGEIAQIQSRLRDTIIPGMARDIADVRFSVASFGDFPVSPYGSGSDRPFRLLQANTASEMLAQNAVNLLSASGGSDGPESQIEGLFQVASGEGVGSWVAPRTCPAGTVGYPCFRPDAAHIVLLFTDAPFHNGPGGANSYTGVYPTPHHYSETVAALRAQGAMVLGLHSGASGREHLVSVARDTGALDAAGNPIVIDIGSSGSGLDAGVIEAVSSLCR